MSKKTTFKATLRASATVAFMLTSGLPCFASASAVSDQALLESLNPVDPTAFGKKKGVQIKMRVQGASVELPHEEEFFARSDVNEGPSDDQLIYAASKRSASPVNGDFSFYSFTKGRMRAADSVSVYGNLRVTSDLFQNDLRDLISLYPNNEKVRTVAKSYLDNTSRMPLFFFVKGEEMENAYYTRFQAEDGTNYRMMNLGWYRPTSSTREYTAQQPDIVWHEAGHALVDAARPDLFSNDPKAGAYHEAWGDTNAMFTLLSHESARKKLIFDVRGDLHQPNFLRSMAEEFGLSVLGTRTGLRDLDKDVKDDGFVGEVHDKSRVLAGAIYDIVVKAYEDRTKINGIMPVKALGDVADYLRTQWVYTLTQVDSTPSFTEIGTILKGALLEHEAGKGYGLPWASYVDAEFTKRDIVLDGTSDPWDWSMVRGKNWSAHTEKAKKKMVSYKAS